MDLFTEGKTVIEFVVPAVPVAQPRQRHRVVTSNGKTFAQNYTPGKHPVQDFKASVRQAFASAWNGAPLKGPIAFDLVFVMPRPANRIYKTKPMPREPYTSSRNDWDNLGKSVADSLASLAYLNDGQIYKASVERWIASGNEQPHVEVRIEAETESQ